MPFESVHLGGIALLPQTSLAAASEHPSGARIIRERVGVDSQKRAAIHHLGLVEEGESLAA